MAAINTMYLHSDLALASYADLTAGISDQDYITALQQDGDGMSAAQAAEFATNWRVVDQYNDTTNGLSATVFESAATGERYLAVRGTEGLLDLWTDFVDIAVLGTPERQAQYASLRDQVGAWLSDGTLTSGFTVSGHSLGGFLAGALLVDYSTEIDHAYLYNAPGVGGLSAGLRLLAGLESDPTLDLTKVSSLISEAGFSLTAGLGLDWGAPIPVLIEDQSPNVLANHSIVHLADALAVQSLLGELSTRANMTTFGDILSAATNQTDWTLESVVNAVGDLFQAGTTITGMESDLRDALYTRIQAIQGSAAYQSAVQSADFAQVVSLASLSSDQIAELATTDIAYRYALVNLTPFALVTSDAALYAPHNLNGELDPENLSEQYLQDRADFLMWKLRVNTQDHTDDVAYFYGSDERYYYDAGSGSQVWVGNPLDVKANTPNLRQALFGNDANDALTGGNTSDRIYGGAGNDQLSGGNGGFDYLEGGQGDDRLEGGRSADTLLGGAGNDTYVYTTGDGKDTIIDTDGVGSVVFDGVTLTGGHAVSVNSQDYLSDDGIHRYSLVQNGSATDLWINDTIIIANFTSGNLGIVLNDALPVEPINVSRVIEGDHPPIEFPDGYHYDDIGNIVCNTSAVVAREDSLSGSVGNDHILGFQLNDRIHAGPGDDLVEGGADIDIVLGYEGNDEIHGGERVDLSSLQTYENFGGITGSGQTGDWLTGGLGQDIVVGGDDNDCLFGGGDEDLILGGPGDDVINGDDNYFPDFGGSGTGFDWNVILQSGHVFNVTYLAASSMDWSYEVGAQDRIYGGAGNDFILGLQGNDYIDGEDGDDIIAGDDDNDTLLGGDGGDTITGDQGRDVYTNGILVTQGNDYIDGGSGDDWLQGEAGNDALLGGLDNDIIYGDANYLESERHGDDYLSGGGGSDLLFGQYGDDWLDGGDGNDSGETAALIGGGGNDLIYGGRGDDDLFGDDDGIPLYDHGNDVLYGQDGNDRLIGHGGNDQLDGGEGQDELYGGDGNDVLIGGSGNDYLNGNAGSDTLDGGAGTDGIYADDDDVVIVRADDADNIQFSGVGGILLFEGLGENDITIDQIDNGDGTQDLRLTAGTSSIRITQGFIASQREYSLIGSDLSQQEIMQYSVAVNLTATPFSDVVYGSNNADIIRGFAAGNSVTDAGDYLYGQGGDDFIYGGAGDDCLDGGAGIDGMFGGDGDDVYVVDNQLDNPIEYSAEGADTVEASISYVAPDFIENVALLGVSTIDAMGNTLANRLFGNNSANTLGGLEGDDLLFGRDGDDVINGGVGADQLFGEDGNDRLDGGAQNDALYGGAGDDVYVALLGGGEDSVVDLAGANAIEFGAGITQASLNLVHYQADDGAQYLRINYGPDGDALLIRDGLSGTIQQYRFSDGSTLTHEALIGQVPVALQIDGSPRNDVIYGSDQADRIDAGLGDDQVFGAAGADTLMGGQGADTLNGGAGDDTLEGGIGDDTLIGGAGEDRYVLQWGMGSDLIIEQGAEQSTLALGNGVQLSDLAIWIDQDDLLVRFAGGDSGVRIQGYGAAPLSWRIEDESGVVHRLDDMASQPPSTATPLNFVEVSASFIDTVRATFIETLTQPGETTGYAMDADGVLRKVNSYIADDYAATVHESAHIAVEDVAADGDTYSQTTSGFSSEFSFSQASIRVATLTAAAGSVGGMAGYGASTATYHSFGSGAGYQIPSGAGVVTVYGPSVDQDGGQNIQLDSYTAEVGTLQPIGVWVFGDGAATGIPSFVPHDISHRDDTLTLTRVTGGAGDNAITVDGHAIVDGGDGNDLIVATAVLWDISYGQYFVPEDPYTLTGQFDDRNVGALLYGNSGADRIAGGAANDLLIGGDGDDTVDGRAGEDVYVVRRGEGGYDIIADSGTSVSINYETGASRYADWYYRSLGMLDYVDRLLRGEILPPLPPLSPNDLDAMAQLSQSGVIETDTVEFSEGISLDQLIVSWGEVVLNSPVLPESQPWMDEQGLRFRTLDISWSEGEGVRIVIPHTYVSPPPYEDDVPLSLVENFTYDRSDETLGLGIERFRFADGSTLSMADMAALAPPSPSFDPHLQDPDMMLTGTSGDDMMAVGNGNDTLDGLEGADQMSGGSGDDVYYVDNPGDVVSEGVDAGTDTVNSSISYALTADVEHLTLTGADAIDGAGNALSNTLTGNEAANVLNGEAGDDTLDGMAGDDILNGGDGNDLLETGYGFDYAYGGAGNDTITGGNNVPGGWLPEYLYGEEGDDLLIGGGKYAHLYGGAGNDELRGGAGYQNLYGEDGDDLLIAGALGYMLDGGEGADRMVGSANNNTYGVDNILDVIVELPGGGTDTVNSSISYVLNDNLENLILVGAGAISGTGNSGNNTLNGSLNAAANTLAGGLGDDTYVIGAGDVIVEQAGGGIDSVNVASSYTLGDNLENLTLTSSMADNGTGNALDNRLVGNGYNNALSGLAGNDYLSGGYGNDTLNGGAGVDEMLGGYGNDVYYVDNSGDLVAELAGQGTDTVYSSISYTLGLNVERLTLTGTAVISAIGNSLANILTGNGVSNLLIGAEGNDTLRGMGGNDWLLGGAGNDVIEGGDGADFLFGSLGNDTVAGGWGSDQYTFARGDGQDVVNDYDARDADPATYGQTTDAVQFGTDIAHDQLWFTRLGNDLQVQVIGTSDRIAVQNWYLGSAYQVEALHAGDGYTLLNTQVEQLVQAMASFAPPASGELSLSASYRQELEPVITANWQTAA